MATKSNSYADRVRNKLRKDAEDALSSSGGNDLEWVPDFGTHKVRFLPPVKLNEKGKLVEDTEGLFYWTHSYHWIPADPKDLRGKNGKYLWTRKQYEVPAGSGKMKRDPIDEAVQQFYSVGRRDDDQELLDLGGVLKRKRNYFAHIILFTEEGPEYKILADRTNEGKLMRIVCATMGIPFWRDVEDNWVDKASAEIDEDKEYFDLIDIEVGHDFKISKKKTGNNPWDISFEDSFPIKKSRALTDDEQELLAERIDLTSHIQYEEDYNNVKLALESVIGADSDDDDDEEVEDTKSVSSPEPKRKVKDDEGETVDPDDEDAIEEMLDELD